MINRLYKNILLQRLTEQPNKIVLLYGPRQAGKTTLVREVLAELPGKKLEINADDSEFAEVFSSRSMRKMNQLVEGLDILFLDEAQRIPEIGINLKLLHDTLPKLRIIASGSSSFELANKTQEPLTGRTWNYTLFPIGLCELDADTSRFEIEHQLEDFLTYGLYPGQLELKNRADKAEHLLNLTRSYLYKDIFEISQLKHPRKLQDLVKLLAFQIGSEVSMNELADKLQMAKETVMSYIDLLEKAFVVFRLSGYSRNLRKEITRHDKVYFYDLGIRNAVIENFNSLKFRNDDGALWENFLVIERLKTQAFRRQNVRRFFWRTYSGAEIDYVEERDGILSGFEFKFSSKTTRPPQSWLTNYPEARFQTVNRDNYLEFLLD